ncbi:MarP family serine protease [Microbacterium sp. Marseille-Q6965]|uniref:MarP family serine protease n=1 Tax=Microbacterium sp. Marseille-Q6965 TaxID=2965072 RepID=UPI0021B73E83|nr:MarP family serine protease [Microbacterium sp. Marseille-Q6965]
MLVVDVIVIAVIVVALLSGLRVGLFTGLGAWAGIAAGALLSPWLAPLASRAVPEPAWRGAALLATVIALLAVGCAIGTAIGAMLRRGADRMRVGALDRLLGGLAGAVAATLAAALAGSVVATAGIPVVSAAVASSGVLRTINRLTPDPVAEALARLRSAVVEDALPTIGGIIDPTTVLPSPDLDVDDPALAAAAASVARISGVAYACGTGSTGSGFVVAEDLVVTNAHVVAGVESVVVELPDRPAVDGRVVYFDPVDDLAVISADVAAEPLTVTTPLGIGAEAAVLGYPYGGPFQTRAGTVMSVGPVEIADIYGGPPTARDTYALAAEVRPGNSGGPLLTPDGEVAGVVFARDEANPGIGYAMTTAELEPVLGAVGPADAPVSTGSCAP